MEYRFVDYTYCQYKVQDLGITSARCYIKWHNEFHPAGFPRRPDRTYLDYWISWNDFLNGNNTYLADAPGAVRKEDILPFWEAVNIVQEFQFNTRDEYTQAFNDGLIPKGIPKYPHKRYTSFRAYGGYFNWLGKNVKNRVDANKNIQPYLILYKTPGRADNVLSIIIHKKGKMSMIELIREKKLQVVKVFHWYDDFANEIFAMLNHYGSQQGDTSWMFANTSDIIYELSTVLELYRP